MSKKQKFYTVWLGQNPGVYSSWAECEPQVKGFEGAKYKSFSTLQEANDAFLSDWNDFIGKNTISTQAISDYKTLPEEERPNLEGIAVDAACKGNPGDMEYRGVDLKTGFQLFHLGPLANGTNNIGEFLAIVHALALFYVNNPKFVIYSDSKIAINWVKNKKAKSKLEKTASNERIFSLIERAEKWLQSNEYANPVLKWNTELWGEIPADFGRKR